MGWKQTVTGFLTFSRKDRAGIIALIILIGLMYALPYLAPSRSEAPTAITDTLQQTLEQLTPDRATSNRTAAADQDYFGPAPTVAAPDFSKAKPFFFDPNVLDAAGWRKLGLREKTVRTILNYRSKGGKFYRPEDLKKIWGLPDGFYDHVAAYIRLEQKGKLAPDFVTAAPERPKPEKKTPAMIDINTADTTAWIALPGIGSKLAARIVNFRNKLGGFVSVEQVGETYGLPDSTFQKIRGLLKEHQGGISKININTATKETLSAHPYINWAQAKAIVAYREQHGPYATVDDLHRIMILDEALLEKIKPYLSVQ